MHKPLPQPHLNRLMRAIVEFGLIEKGDRILIGFSGGKDSAFLAYALAAFRHRLNIPIELAAITIDPMFTPDFQPEPLAAFCASLNLPFAAVKVDIAGAIEAQNGKDPCFTCAYFRRGAINRHARARGFNKIAYAHHHDDAVETFLMSLLYSGQLKTFAPLTRLSRSGLTVIRPLVYFCEAELRAAAGLHGFIPRPSPCPRDGKTKRQEVKLLIEALRETNPSVYAHLAAAMRGGAAAELWPPEPGRAAMKARYGRLMRQIRDTR